MKSVIFIFKSHQRKKKRKIKKEKARERLLLSPTDRGLRTELLYRDTPPTVYINWQADTAALSLRHALTGSLPSCLFS